jgi:hypothetical protein
MKDTKSGGDKIMAMGSFSVCARYFGNKIIPYVEKLFPLVIKSIKSDDNGLKRNALYCIGNFENSYLGNLCYSAKEYEYLSK